MIRFFRRADALYRTAWRAAPLLATVCVLVALAASVLMLAYPLGFRAPASRCCSGSSGGR